AGEGQLKEQGGGCTFFWKAKQGEERQLHGVGFAIKNELINQLNEFPIGINERLMTLCLNLYATIISAYAPTLDADNEIKEEFYSNLDQVLSGIPEQKQCRQKINVERLKDPIKRDLFHQCLNKKLKNSNQLQQESVSSIWGALKSTIISASVETLGFSTRKRQDWFDENDREIQELINRKCKAFCAWQNDINSKQKKLHHQRTKAEVQRRIRGMKNRWWEDKAKEIQHLADIYNIR
uniref:Uncharacterized protein n=1 Tax=Latimeria chalumnae TaxID=7897 RepID=H3AQM2_LATCH